MYIIHMHKINGFIDKSQWREFVLGKSPNISFSEVISVFCFETRTKRELDH